MSRARIRRLTIALVWAVLAAQPLAASAQEGSGDASRAGTSYVGAGFSYGVQNFDRDEATNVDDAYGGNFWIGFRLADFWSLETQVEYLNGFDLSFAGQDGDGEYIAATVNAKFFPLATLVPGRVEPFVFVGAGAGRIRVSISGRSSIDEVAFLTRAGGGVDFYIVEDLAIQVSASFVQPTQDLNNYSYTSTMIGLQYRF